MLRLATCLLLLALGLAFASARLALADDSAPPPEPATASTTPTTAAAPGFDPPPPDVRAKQAPPTPVGVRAARLARRLVGIRYTWGGTSPRTGFDCSGLVRYVWARFGVRLAHSSYAQFGTGRRVVRRALKPGDLVFFDGAGHVGLYVGGGRFVHAPHTGTTVQVSRLAGPYGAGYDGARRVQ
jgi:peptidoglycan DL-endopeptidase CwlO